MARGWESKSVEDQQAQYAESHSAPHQRLTPDQLAKRRIVDGLILSRKRIVQQLQTSQSAQQRTMLESALSHRDAEMARLG